ncbi:MAG: hypothetical protein PHF64_10350, partial [Methanoregula sp.]|nr:hypothetical protein [Methanoregula sp.]
DERALVTIRHYALTKEHLADQVAMIERAVQCAAAAVPDAAGGTGAAGGNAQGIVMEILRAENRPRGIAVEEVLGQAEARGVSSDLALAAIRALIEDDECYQPQKGYLRPL